MGNKDVKYQVSETSAYKQLISFIFCHQLHVYLALHISQFSEIESKDSVRSFQ